MIVYRLYVPYTCCYACSNTHDHFGRVWWMGPKQKKSRSKHGTTQNNFGPGQAEIMHLAVLGRGHGPQAGTSTTYLWRHKIAYSRARKGSYSFGHPHLIMKNIRSNLASCMLNHGDEISTIHWLSLIIIFNIKVSTFNIYYMIYVF